PLYHDMGLLGTLLGPLGLGAEVWLMPPHAFLKRPARWLSWMSKVGCTHTAAPNFAFDLCVRKTPQEVLERLDLSRVQVIVNGAEPVRRDTLDRFNQTFAAAGLNPDAVSPSFGLAEVGLFASVAPKGRRLSHLTLAKGALARHRVQAALPGEPEAVAVVSCGVAWGDARFEVVHPERRTRVGGAQVGEIWIAGGHVARGYWRQPELSEAAFRARLADDPEAGPFLRTGDLGFVQDGDLYITGRRKDLLIIRGRNLYPQDIERSLDGTREALPEVRPGCAAAVAIQVDGVEQLAVFQEVEPGRNAAHDPEQVVSALRDAVLRDHEVRPHTVVLLAKGSLPKTSSG
ncbi:MAG: AMP-binding protein, partial [Myxococcales bacterium]|nr:AMP-binding protein [Myxococcales bacterium]